MLYVVAKKAVNFSNHFFLYKSQHFYFPYVRHFLQPESDHPIR